MCDRNKLRNKGEWKMENEWVKEMPQEIERLKNKMEQKEELSFSEKYFVHTIQFLSEIFYKNIKSNA